MSYLINGIHHIALKCHGLEHFEETITFYRDCLGLPVVRTWGTENTSGMMLNTGNGIIEIFADANDAPSQGAVRHFALATNDVDACVNAVKNAGYQVFVEPTDISIPSTPPFPARIAFCHGPAGEEIEFFQEK